MIHLLAVDSRRSITFFFELIILFFLNLNLCLAHELDENRASIVLRNETNISVTLYINIFDALHKTLAPQRDSFEFIGYLASLNETDFSKQWVLATHKLEQKIHVRLLSGEILKVSTTNWGAPQAVHKLFKEITMRSIIEKNRHLHSEPYEVKFQINANKPTNTLKVEIPEVLRPMTIVSNRIKQSRISSDRENAIIEF